MSGGAQEELQAVLRAFALAHPCPTAEDIYAWAMKYPSMKAEIEEFGLIMAWMSDPLPDIPEAPGPEDEAALDPYPASAKNLPHRTRTGPRLAELAAKAGVDFATLGGKIAIDQRVLNALEAGRIQLPTGRRLIEALAVVFATSAEAVEAALATSYERPKLGLAKADGQPSSSSVSFEAAIEGSDMSDAQKAYWKSDR